MKPQLPKEILQMKCFILVHHYLMNSPINLHWNNEVCIADRLHEDKKEGKYSKT